MQNIVCLNSLPDLSFVPALITINCRFSGMSWSFSLAVKMIWACFMLSCCFYFCHCNLCYSLLYQMSFHRQLTPLLSQKVTFNCLPVGRCLRCSVELCYKQTQVVCTCLVTYSHCMYPSGLTHTFNSLLSSYNMCESDVSSILSFY